ncbi:ABC transporter ATP-binding protein [Priestia endophytica]|uniref:ABC transporter ATP-binding protein n=1 Tax=Priestia endophytica TaxID=135735 RepID=UPI00124EE18A|nr:ATP-binding cassette domain-containing protein [Priestia endophytica]KAB2489468.1 ATP-binding cassette domain-containing protein [Priestia endophytica]
MRNHLQIKNLTKKLQSKTILKDINFEMSPGEIVGFIGPNGAGKTTTIKLITGLLRIDEGDIRVGEVSIKKNRKDFLKQIGAIVENPEFYSYLTGFENLKILSNIYGNIKDSEILEIIKIVKMEKYIHKKVGKYSLGMKQRLGIAQALLHNPQFLILDEPTNGLDPDGILDLRKNLQYLSKKKSISILISSHHLHELDLICDKFIFIKEGCIVSSQSNKKQSNFEIYGLNVQPINSALNQLINKFPETNPKIIENEVIVEIQDGEITEIADYLIKTEHKLSGMVKKNNLEQTYQKIHNG